MNFVASKLCVVSKQCNTVGEDVLNQAYFHDVIVSNLKLKGPFFWSLKL
jgi:hypothetical protein